MTKFLFFGAFLATTCGVAVQGQAIRQLYDARGVPLNPSEKFVGFFEDTKKTLKACAVAGEGTECDVYLNIHTDYSFYLNPTAFGCNRAQLVVEDISDDGIIQFGVVDGKATSSNMNVIMKTCEEASDSGIGCGEVKWESGQVYQDRDVNYLPARNDLGGKKKEACRGFNFEMTLDTSDNLVIGKLSVQLDEDLETEDMWGSDTQTHTNDVIIGVHLHLGASDEDGPPSVVFCGSSNEYPLPSSDIICEDAM